MMQMQKVSSAKSMLGLDRTPFDQVSENLKQALRVLDLVPADGSELVPHPLIIARAEIKNAQRYLKALEGVQLSGDAH